MTYSLVDTWRSIILGGEKSWVLFQHGTCVILMEPEVDLGAQATRMLEHWGLVHAGSSAGDFTTITLSDYPGWVITGHHPDVLNYVSPNEIEDAAPSDVVVGLMGRSKRNQDAEAPKIIHIEDMRGVTQAR